MKRMVFLEGLQGVGKSTIIKTIKNLNISNTFTVDEIINEDIINDPLLSIFEESWIKNDEQKIKKYNDGLIIIDRGPISTLSYNMTKSLININFNPKPVIDWFYRIKNIFNDENTRVLHLTNSNNNYLIRKPDELDPNGSIINQKLLESISIYNCEKHVKYFSIIKFDKSKMKEILDEILD
jgi:nucleoside-triphosphatase THEP1